MRTTANLGLTVWDLVNDPFSSEELAANWDAIDAQFGSSSVDTRPSRFLESGTTLPVTSLTNGRVFYLTATASGIPANTICKYDGTAWKAIGRPEILASVPTLGNYAGRLVTLSSASGSFGAWDTILWDGSAWRLVGGIQVFTTLPVTGNYAGRVVVVTADPAFPAYSTVIYNGSAWSKVERRGVEVVSSFPGSPYSGQVVVLDTAVSPFRAWDVARYNGSSWGKVGGGTLTGTTMPATPSDGDTFIYQVDPTNGINWRFQYNSASASTYKWEFIGGSELIIAVNTAQAPASWNTWVDLATVGPSWTVPAGFPSGGDFLVRWGANSQGNTQQFNTTQRIAIWNAASSALSTREAVNGTQNMKISVSEREVLTGISTGTEMRMRYRTDQGGSSGVLATQEYRWLSITPVRVG